MAKSTPAPAAAEAEPAPAPAPEPVLTLDEACALLSAHRPGERKHSRWLLSAFNKLEELAGRTSGTEAEYRARFAALASAPAE